MKNRKHSFKYYWLRIKLGILSFAGNCYIIIRNCFYDICLVVSIIAFIIYYSIFGILYRVPKILVEYYILHKSSEECISEFVNWYNKTFSKWGVTTTNEELDEAIRRKNRL